MLLKTEEKTGKSLCTFQGASTCDQQQPDAMQAPELVRSKHDTVKSEAPAVDFETEGRYRWAVDWMDACMHGQTAPVSKEDPNMPRTPLPHICHQSNPKVFGARPPPLPSHFLHRLTCTKLNMHKGGSHSVGHLAASAAEELAR